MDETLKMLKDLTDAPGISGYEEPARRVMRRYLEPLGELLTDNLGSIIGRKVGQADGDRAAASGSCRAKYAVVPSNATLGQLNEPVARWVRSRSRLT